MNVTNCDRLQHPHPRSQIQYTMYSTAMGEEYVHARIGSANPLNGCFFISSA